MHLTGSLQMAVDDLAQTLAMQKISERSGDPLAAAPPLLLLLLLLLSGEHNERHVSDCLEAIHEQHMQLKHAKDNIETEMLTCCASIVVVVIVVV